MQLAPSVRSRQLLREFLAGTVLGYIRDVFDGAEIKRGVVPPERLPGGQRRSLVEEYYAGVDWGREDPLIPRPRLSELRRMAGRAFYESTSESTGARALANARCLGQLAVDEDACEWAECAAGATGHVR